MEREAFAEDQQATLHNDGPQAKIEYRPAWAWTSLKGMGLLTNSKRGGEWPPGRRARLLWLIEGVADQDTL